MKRLFLVIALALAAAGAALQLTGPKAEGETPILYWVIDPAPARPEQVALFHLWLIEKGHGENATLRTPDDVTRFRQRRFSPAIRDAIRQGNPDGTAALDAPPDGTPLPLNVRIPLVEMRVDAANNDTSKKIIQGVSGVAGDIIEAYGFSLEYMAGVGMLADLTDDAAVYGFQPEKTYPALRPSLFFLDRQYAFPRNPSLDLFWVNKDVFQRLGLPPPPARWTTEEFEAFGRRFAAATAQPGKRRTVFFANAVPTTALRRGMGLSVFNETLTACALDDPREVRLLERVRKWTYEDNLVPSAADRAAIATEGGWGGQDFQMFKNGQYGLFSSGRWALMLFRKFGAMNLAVTEYPHDGFPNTIFTGGQSTVYAASRHPVGARLFLAYMADEAYNMQIVRDGDALPPNPIYTDNELFRRPPEHPNEWGCHEAFAEAAARIGVPQSISPFVVPFTASRLIGNAYANVMNDRATPHEAAATAARQVNQEIARTLAEDPKLSALHREWSALQTRVDEARRANRRVPAAWIKNPFHIVYYKAQGWLDE